MSCVQLVPLFGEERSEKGKTGRCLSRSTKEAFLIVASKITQVEGGKLESRVIVR